MLFLSLGISMFASLASAQDYPNQKKIRCSVVDMESIVPGQTIEVKGDRAAYLNIYTGHRGWYEAKYVFSTPKQPNREPYRVYQRTVDGGKMSIMIRTESKPKSSLFFHGIDGLICYDYNSIDQSCSESYQLKCQYVNSLTYFR
jgi:hypothetical protein